MSTLDFGSPVVRVEEGYRDYESEIRLVLADGRVVVFAGEGFTQEVLDERSYARLRARERGIEDGSDVRLRRQRARAERKARAEELWQARKARAATILPPGAFARWAAKHDPAGMFNRELKQAYSDMRAELNRQAFLTFDHAAPEFHEPPPLGETFSVPIHRKA